MWIPRLITLSKITSVDFFCWLDDWPSEAESHVSSSCALNFNYVHQSMTFWYSINLKKKNCNITPFSEQSEIWSCHKWVPPSLPGVKLTEELIWISTDRTSSIIGLNCHLNRAQSWPADTIFPWEPENWPECGFNWSRDRDGHVHHWPSGSTRGPLTSSIWIQYCHDMHY